MRLDDKTAASPVLTGGTTMLLAVACGTMAASLYYGQPLVGLIGPALHMRPDLYGLVVTLTQVGYVLGLLFLVPLGDMLDSRRLVTVMICLAATALAGASLAPNAAVFLALSLLIGLFCTALQMLVPLAAHLAPEAIRGRVVGNVMSGLITGILLARPIASLLSEAVGWRGVFGLAAVTALGLAVLLYVRLPSRQPVAPPAYAELIRSMVDVLRQNPILRRRIAYQARCSPGFRSSGPRCRSSWRGRRDTCRRPGSRSSPWRVRPGAGGPAGRARGRPGFLPRRHRPVARERAGGFRPVPAVRRLADMALVLGALLIDLGVQGNQIISQRAIYELAPAIRSRAERPVRRGVVHRRCCGIGAGGRRLRPFRLARRRNDGERCARSRPWRSGCRSCARQLSVKDLLTITEPPSRSAD